MCLFRGRFYHPTSLGTHLGSTHTQRRISLGTHGNHGIFQIIYKYYISRCISYVSMRCSGKCSLFSPQGHELQFVYVVCNNLYIFYIFSTAKNISPDPPQPILSLCTCEFAVKILPILYKILGSATSLNGREKA